MKSLAKKALLTTAFASVALLAGCSGKKQPSAPASLPAAYSPAHAAPAKAGPHYFTPEEVASHAQKLFDSRGQEITATQSCALNTPNGYPVSQEGCTYTVQSKQDDGVSQQVYYRLQDGVAYVQSCSLRANDPVADKATQADAAIFARSARQKFGKMGFSVLDNFGNNNSNVSKTDDGSCRNYLSAAFLLKQDGNLYSATLYQSFGFPGPDPSGTLVQDLQPVTRVAPKP